MPDYYWFLIAAGTILILCILVGCVIVLGIIKPRRRSLLETSNLEEGYSKGIMEFYSKHLTEQYKVVSKFGYNLQVYFLKNKEETNQYIVMSHGHTYTHHGCIKYARMMMQYGYNIVLYDQPYHGNSEGKYTSLGHKEKHDLYEVINDTITRYGPNITLGTYGESMGAVTVLLEAAFDNRISFIISDCGFSNLRDLLIEILKNKFKIPRFPFLWFSDQIFHIITGTTYNGISPIDALKQINIPILFVHGKADNFISYHHTEKMFKSYQGPKQLFLAKNESLHASSYYKDTKNYEKSVKIFLEEFQLLKMNK